MEARNMLAFPIAVLLVILQGATALFEDQAGKFDWYFYLFPQYKTVPVLFIFPCESFFFIHNFFRSSLSNHAVCLLGL